MERHSLTTPVIRSATEVAAQTKRVCSNGLCFETASVSQNISTSKWNILTVVSQLEMNNTDMTLGFAMPEEDRGEFLVNASIPLPYGFLSFTMGDNGYNYSSHP